MQYTRGSVPWDFLAAVHRLEIIATNSRYLLQWRKTCTGEVLNNGNGCYGEMALYSMAIRLIIMDMENAECRLLTKRIRALTVFLLRWRIIGKKHLRYDGVNWATSLYFVRKACNFSGSMLELFIYRQLK